MSINAAAPLLHPIVEQGDATAANTLLHHHPLIGVGGGVEQANDWRSRWSKWQIGGVWNARAKPPKNCVGRNCRSTGYQPVVSSLQNSIKSTKLAHESEESLPEGQHKGNKQRRLWTSDRMATRHDNSPRSLIAARRRAASKPTRRTGGLTRRVKSAIEALVFDGMNQKEAAVSAGFTDRAFRAALNKPAVLAYYRAQLQALREGERAANLRTAIAIRDDAKLKANAAGAKVRLLAAQQLDSDLVERGRSSVNVAIGVKVETPGYVIDLSDFPPEAPTIDHDARGQGSLADDGGAGDDEGYPGTPFADSAPGSTGWGQKSGDQLTVHPHTRDFPSQEIRGGQRR